MSNEQVQLMRKKMHLVLNKLIWLIKNKPDKLLKGMYMRKNPKEGEYCIVGHFLTKEDKKTVVTEGCLSDPIETIWDGIKSKKIKSLPLDFWGDIQELNDCAYGDLYWTKKGLTKEGDRRVQEIRDRIDKCNTLQDY